MLNRWGQAQEGLHREWTVAGCERPIGFRQMELPVEVDSWNLLRA